MLKSLDLFPKIQQDQAQQIRKTMLGGILFVVTVTLTLLLVANELYMTFIKGEIEVQSFVESSNLDQRVRVNLNISLHQVPCHALSLELQDVTGAHLEDVKYTLHKLSLHPNGSFLNQAKAQSIQSLEKYISYPSNPIVKAYKNWKQRGQKIVDDCYGAQLYEGQRCTTCQDVMLAFAARDWPQPPRESIAQCMPDRKATVQLLQFEQEFNQMMSDQQDEILDQISKDMLEVEEREREVERRRVEMEGEQPSVLKDVLSMQQKRQFAQTLQELSEIGQNPMQWNQERLQEEKLAKVGSLINMLNVSLDDYTAKLQSQVRFADREIVIADRKLLRERTVLTHLQRFKCDKQAIVELHVYVEDGSVNETFLVSMEPEQCNVSLAYECTEMVDERIMIEARVGDHMVAWMIRKAGAQSLLSNLHFNITNVTLSGEMQRRSKPLIDVPNRSFRLSVYVPLKSKRRMLYQEDFSLRDGEDRTLDLADASDIQEHLGEGCQLFGHLFIKKVPGSLHLGFHGRGEAARLLSNNFSVAHTIHLLELTDEKEVLSLGRYIDSTNPLDHNIRMNEVDQDSNYYLKVVSSIYESFWRGAVRMYTFTAHEKTTHAREKLPAVIFRYEFDAVTMRYRLTRGSLASLIISIFGIIGGVFAVSNMFAKLFEFWGW